MRTLLAAAALALASAPASAGLGPSLGEELMSSPDGVHELSLHVGGFHPTGRVGYANTGSQEDRYGGNGAMFGFNYFRALNRVFALGGEYDYISRGAYEASNVFVLPAKTFVRGDTSLIMAVLRIRKPGAGWRPYAIAGIGLHRSHMQIYGEQEGVQSAIYMDDNSGLAWMGRAGLEYAAPSGGFIGLEGGYVGARAESYSPTALGLSGSFPIIKVAPNGISYLLRAGVRFGAGS